MTDDAELLRSLIPAAFSFAAAVAGLLWNERSKRREAERQFSHTANMIRRVLVSEFDVVRAMSLANAERTRKPSDDDMVSLYKPTMRHYSTADLGFLTLEEVRLVVAALATLADHQLTLEELKDPDTKTQGLIVMEREASRVLVENFVTLADQCSTAIAAIRAETGPTN